MHFDVPRFVVTVMTAVLVGCRGGVPSSPESRPATEVGTSQVTPEARDAAPLVVPRDERDERGGSRARPTLRDEEIAAIEREIGEATTLYDRQDYGRALARIRALRDFALPEPWNHRSLALEVQIKSALLRTTYVSAFIEVRRQVYTIGDVIEGDVVLMNISTERLVVPGAEDSPIGGETVQSLTLLRTNVHYREWLPDYSMVDRHSTLNYVVDQPITLESGEVRRFPLVIDTMAINPGGTMLRTYTLTAELRSTAIRIGDETFREPICFTTATARVLPRNAEHLADHPAARIVEAIAKNSPLHLTLAAAFVAPADRDAVLRSLRNELARTDVAEAVRRGIMSALRILTAVDLPCEPRRWIDWLDGVLP